MEETPRTPQDRDDQNANGINGHPDEITPPKRENPYLRKNRPKPERRTPPPPPPPTHSAEDEGRGYVRRRTFSDWIFEHIRWIAALVTAACIVSFFLIFDVEEMIQTGVSLLESISQQERSEVSMTYVHGLTDRAQSISWDDLKNFRRTENKTTYSVTWMIPVKDSDYEIWISGESTGKIPTYVRLYHMETGAMLDLSKVKSPEELEDFLRENLE